MHYLKGYNRCRFHKEKGKDKKWGCNSFVDMGYGRAGAILVS
jgi:hypothetical protein